MEGGGAQCHGPGSSSYGRADSKSMGSSTYLRRETMPVGPAPKPPIPRRHRSTNETRGSPSPRDAAPLDSTRDPNTLHGVLGPLPRHLRVPGMRARASGTRHVARSTKHWRKGATAAFVLQGTYGR
eukprot:4331624-Pyramimonas_sp.AAC.1